MALIEGQITNTNRNMDTSSNIIISWGHTKHFCWGKIDFPRENLPEYTLGKFISGLIFPRRKAHTDENDICRYFNLQGAQLS